MRFVSWNVLHLANEIKYNSNSPILKKYNYDKSDYTRTDDITRFLICNTDSDTIICLQECSEMLYKNIYKYFSQYYDLFRISSKQENVDQFLITISPKHYKFQQEELLVNYNTSYGYLSITNDEYRIINCHLRPQFAVEENVYKFIEDLDESKKLIILGDFNEKRCYLLNRFKNQYQIPFFGNTYKKKQIDNVLMNFKQYYKCFTIKNNLISDHHMISMSFI